MRTNSAVRLVLLSAFVLAQSISYANRALPSGPTSTGKGSTQLYTFNSGSIISGANFQATNAASITYAGVNGTTYSAYITWSSTATSGTVSMWGGGDPGTQYGGTLNVTLVSCTGILSPISLTNGSRCGSGTVNLSATAPNSSYQVRWYNAESGAILLTGAAGALSTYTTPSLSATTNYSATAYLTSSGCESPPLTLTATVNTTPTATLSNKTICTGSSTGVVITNNVPSTLNTWTVTVSNVNGSSNGSGTSSSSTPFTYTLNQTLTSTGSGTATYTVTPSAGGCTGSNVTLTVTVANAPTVSVSPSSQTLASGSNTTFTITNPNSVAGTTFSWTETQSNATGASNGSGSSIAQTLSATSTSANGTVTYAVTPAANGCTGTPASVTATVIPQQMTSSSIQLGSGYPSGTGSFSFCQFQASTININLASPPPGATVTGTITVNGTQTSVCAGSGCSSPSSVTLTNAAAGSYNVSYSLNTSFSSYSFSESVSAHYYLGTLPTPNASFTYSGNQCGPQTISYTTTPPQCVRWYWQTSATGTSLANAATSFSVSASGTYYLRPYYAAVGMWGTAQATNNISYNFIPTAYAVGYTGNNSFCSGTAPPSVTLAGSQTGVNYQLLINGVNSGSAKAGTGSVLTWASQSTAGTYTVSASMATCTATMTGNTVVTANVTPLAPTVTGFSRFGTGSLTLTASGGLTNATYIWANSSGTLQSSTSANYTTQSVSISATNYCTVYIINPGACQGPAATVNINVYPQPAITSNTNTLSMGTQATLDAGAGYDSYTWTNSAGVGVGTSETFTTAITDTYKVTVTKTGATGSATYTLNSQFTGLNMNYIVTTTLLADSISNTALLPSLMVSKANQSIGYFDGLGRPLQMVGTQASPQKADLVQPVVYDAFGREPNKYLPFAKPNGNGWYVTDPVGAQSGNYASSLQYNFYNSGTAGKTANDSYPYAQTVFEPSPLNRPSQDFGPGAGWRAASAGSDKYVYHQYLVYNTASEQVIAWDISTGLPLRSTASNTSISGGYYITGQINIKSTKDEQGNEVREYVDLLGRTILKKVQAASGSPALTDPTSWTQTYYIYDDFNLLRFVLQPELVKTIVTNGTNPSITDLANFAFQYKYDGRHRMVTKRVPGADSVFMVYDNRDRLVMTQDANQRIASQWLVTKYDTLNRPVMTALYSPGSSITRVTMNGMISTSKFCENYASTFTSNHGYSDRVFPTTNLTVLTVNYYDNYSFITDLAEFGSNYAYLNTEIPIDNTNHIRAQAASNNAAVLGRQTGGKVNVLGTTGYLKRIVYYDPKYRVIQTISDNNKGGLDLTTNLVDFTGRILKTKTTHKTSTHSPQIVIHRPVYDHASRVKNIYHQVNSNPEILLVANEYNEIGLEVTKKLYSTDGGSTFKQNVDKRYNIRGWINSINNSQLANDGGVTNSDANDFFGMNLSYNDAVSGLNNSVQYNGNVSAVRWSKNLALGSTKDVAYNYSYDPLGRLLNANYMTDNAGVWSVSSAYGEGNFTYDKNGNIFGLVRTNNTGAQMDSLKYTYNGNQLLKVSDGGDITKGFIDGNRSGNDYVYDANGNMTVDNNKGITLITYNYLNQPQQVNRNTGEKMIFTYDASGKKLSQQVYNASGALTKTTDYVGEFIYQNDTLQFISHEEGRVVMKNIAGPEYQYHLKDHLGNVRLTFTTQPGKDTNTGTFETANVATESAQFQRYDDARTINSTLFNHTSGGSYSQRLNGTANEKYGLARSMSVMAGDSIQMEVYEKYVDGNSNNWTAALTTLMGQIASHTAGVVVDGANYSTSGITPFPYAGLDGTGNSTGAGPKAYLNWLFFDRNYVFVNGGYVQMTSTPKENGSNVPFEKLAASFVASQPGYVYVYLSNENPTPVDVYFDDFTITQIKSPVVQQEDFYPFGATFNSYSRENSVPNKYLYNKGSELVDDLGVQIYLTDLREYDPWGRLGWWQVDSKADLAGQESWTPYHYAFNNPIRYNDPKGDCPPDKPNCKEPDVKASGPYAESSKGTAQAGVARVNLQAKDGKEQVNVNVTVVGGTATAKGDTKNGLTGQAKAEAKGLAMDATYKVGSDKNNAQGTIDARLGTADARAKGSLTLAGASVGLGAGAAVGSAEGKGSVTLFGVTLEVSGLVTGGSAHAGLEATLQPFGGSGKSAIAVKADLGLGAGGGLGISISW